MRRMDWSAARAWRMQGRTAEQLTALTLHHKVTESSPSSPSKCRGGMVFTFLAARGLPTGSSLVEASKVDMARQLEVAAKERGVKLLLPSDVVVARSFPSDTCPEPEHRIVAAHAIPEGWMVGLLKTPCLK